MGRQIYLKGMYYYFYMESNLDTQLLRYNCELVPNKETFSQVLNERDKIKRNNICLVFPFCRVWGFIVILMNFLKLLQLSL